LFGKRFVVGGFSMSNSVAFNGSFQICRQITANAGSSFPIAFRLLPPPKRRAMDALYAFMRVTDDLGDEPGEPGTQRRHLTTWRAELEAVLAGRFSPEMHPIFPALAVTVRRFDIPCQYLFDAVDGVESDLEPAGFATFTDLYPYCYRVASAVGLACVRVWGLRPGATWEEARYPAEAAGIAFQLTNILRDLGEDLGRGRVYLPTDELTAFGCPPEDWNPTSEAFRAMMRFQTERARHYYNRAAGLERFLTHDGIAIYRVMCDTYRQLLEHIARRDFDVFTQRVRVPRGRKCLALFRGWATKWGWA